MRNYVSNCTEITGLDRDWECSFLTILPDIIENCLFILWRHLDFYFVHCIPSDEERRMLAGPTLGSSHMRRLQGTVGAQTCSIFFSVLKRLLLPGKTKQV